MQTCKTCVYWESGECDLVNCIQRDPNTRFEIEANAADDTDLRASLKTGPDFGCIHHSPRSEKGDK